MTGFDKKYIAKEKEKELLEFWEEQKLYKFNSKSSKPIFSIDTPPPTMSGKMHIGHAFSYTQTDFIARYKRMKGFEVFYPFGTDDNGLPTEKIVEKEKKVNLRKLTREEAIKVTMEYLNKERPQFIQDWKNLGQSSDFELCYSTISPYAQKLSQQSFIELFKKGLVEQKEGPVMWDRKFQTSIAQAELEDKKLKSTLNYIKAKIKGTENTYMIYATTRPELLFGCVGMSVENQGNYVKLKVDNEYWITGAKTYKDKFKNMNFEVVEKLQGQNVIGEKVIIPLSGNEVPIDHDISVLADYGTGIVYFCTYGGMDCIEWMSRRPNIKPINLINKDGRLNEKNGKYKGIITTEARKPILDDLEKEGALIQKEVIEHIVNVGERSGAEIEYIVSKQWYVKYLDKKEYFFEMAQKFNWHPEFMKHRLENWIKGLNWDWGFSRQRHFGIPIPVWSCPKCSKVYVAEEKQLPVDPTQDVCPVKKCSCGNTKFYGENDVFDTWFTSASTPSLSINLVEDEKIRKQLFPMDLRPQAHDIINFWLFYTMAKNNLMYGQNPFKHVAVSGWMLDPNGKKMSKSKGNVIAPQDIAEKYSNDALRYMAAASKLGQDLPYQEKDVQTGIKVANKIYNASKFASMLLKSFKVKDKQFDVKNLRSIDKWILSKLSQIITSTTKSFEDFDYAKAKAEWESFFMKDIADNYLEIVKQRLWQPDTFGKEETLKAQQALYTTLYASVRGLAPFMPFITEDVYQNFFKNFEKEESIHISSWPEIDKSFEDSKAQKFGEQFIGIVGEVRKFKTDKQLSMKDALEEINIEAPKELLTFITDSLADLKAVTNTKNIVLKEGKFKVILK